MRLLFFLTLAITLASFLVPTSSLALIKLNLDYPEFGNVTLDCDPPLPSGKVCGQNPNALIAWIYYFIVGIAGLAAFVMLVFGGIQWLTSGAIPSQAGEARDKIRNAILGLLLVLASFLIIQVINPELTILSVPGFDKAVGTVPTLPASTAGNSATLTANKKEFTSIKPGEKVTLDWSSTISPCTGLSDPTGLWSGTKDKKGQELVDTSTQPEGSFL
ncbi:MAG: pilin, partial [Patescibacteria group bacterium]